MRRKARLTERIAAAQETGKLLVLNVEDRHFERANEDKEYLDFKKIFGNNNPTVLEIGCGKGQFCCELAKQDPGINVLAVEKSSNVIIDAAERAIAENIPNLILIRTDAEYLPKYIPERSISRIYLNFSCPFPKKSYEGHRLTHRRFLEAYKTLMAEGAEIHQKTDNMEFFEFSVRELTQSGFAIKSISLNYEGGEDIETEYEHKFREQGARIYRLEAYVL